MKKATKKIARSFWGVLPRGLKNAVRNTFAQLSGTREIRDSFRHIYGDYETYEKLLKDKSDITEYHVDKVIRSIGKQVVELKQENRALTQRIKDLEGRL